MGDLVKVSKLKSTRTIIPSHVEPQSTTMTTPTYNKVYIFCWEWDSILFLSLTSIGRTIILWVVFIAFPRTATGPITINKQKSSSIITNLPSMTPSIILSILWVRKPRVGIWKRWCHVTDQPPLLNGNLTEDGQGFL